MDRQYRNCTKAPQHDRTNLISRDWTDYLKFKRWPPKTEAAVQSQSALECACERL